VFLELLPELQLLRLRIGQVAVLGVTPHRSLPFIRTRNHSKLRSRWRIPDLPELDGQKEEVDVFVGVLIEPVDSLTMFLSNISNDPDHEGSFKTCCVRNELP